MKIRNKRKRGVIMKTKSLVKLLVLLMLTLTVAAPHAEAAQAPVADAGQCAER